MRPGFQARLTNASFGDPGVYVDLPFQRRALLFDIGSLTQLLPRELLRVSDVFVTHAHVDHFCGFDQLLRVCLGRKQTLRLYGPAGFLAQLHHKLAAYTWNLVQNYPVQLEILGHELQVGTQRLLRAQFRSGVRFAREELPAATAPAGVLLAEPLFRVRATPLEHHDIVSLGFAFEEGVHINVLKNRLEELRLPTGPWLTELKRQVRAGAPDDAPLTVRWRTREGARERRFALGELRRQLLQFVAGQRLCYVTDVADSDANRRALGEFLRDADLLFIEAVFLDADRAQATRKAHLTARAAGELARAAGVRAAIPFHFSTRYQQREAELRAEFAAAWQGREVDTIMP